MNRDHSTEHLQLAHGCGSVDSEARISHQYVPTRILEAKEQLRASRRLVRFTQRRERFESRLDPAEAHLAASDADASQTGRPKAFAREDAEVTLPRTVPDVLRPDLPLDALDSAPPRDDCLDARHELDGVLRRQRRESARRPKTVERRSREEQGRINLQEVRPVVRILEQSAQRIEVSVVDATEQTAHHARADF